LPTRLANATSCDRGEPFEEDNTFAAGLFGGRTSFAVN
jgi:hypothetical protein